MADAALGPTTGLTPHLTIPDGRAAAAIAFYRAAFDADERARVPADDGVRLMHAHLIVNGGALLLNDAFPEYQGPAETGSGAIERVMLHLQVDDADRWFDRAVAAGATVRMPIADMFWGDRYGQIVDPFGVVWAIGAPIGDGGR